MVAWIVTEMSDEHDHILSVHRSLAGARRAARAHATKTYPGHVQEIDVVDPEFSSLETHSAEADPNVKGWRGGFYGITSYRMMR